MTQTHWKKLQNPDYLGAYSLEPGKDMILTLSGVKQEKVTGPDGKKEECMVARFKENVKPMILNVTNCKTIEKLYKTPYIEEWSGRKIQIYVEKVKAFGDVVDALRIRPFVPVDKNVETHCADCGNEITAFENMTAEKLAQYTASKYGKPLCAECAQKSADDKRKSTVANPLDAKSENDTPEEGFTVIDDADE